MRQYLYNKPVYQALLFLCLLFIADFGAILLADDPFLEREKASNRRTEEKRLKQDPVTEDNFSPDAFNQQNESSSEQEGAGKDTGKNDTEGEVAKTSATRNSFPGYGAYRELLVDYCTYLIADGHFKRVQDILDSLLAEKAQCPTCRQLYRALSCKVPTKVALTPRPKLQYPSTELLAALSGVFGDIAKNPNLAGITAENLRPILKELEQSSDKTTDLYFDFFLAYIKTPLSKQLQDASKQEQKREKKVKQKELEALF